MTARPRHLPYAALLTAALTLSACSGEVTAQTPAASASGPTTPSTRTVTSTATPTNSAPSTTPASSSPPASAPDPVLARIPPAARSETAEGAAAYVTFYMQEVNRAFRTADPTILDGLSSPDCKTCGAYRRGVQQVGADGQKYGGDLVRVIYATAAEFTAARRQVLISIEQRSVPVMNEAGSTVSMTDSGKGTLVATLRYKARWRIDRLQEAT